MAARDFAPELGCCPSHVEAMAAGQYEAVVFRRLPDCEDFAQSQTIVLPGQHTAEEAWAMVHAELRSGAAQLIGGEVRPTQ